MTTGWMTNGHPIGSNRAQALKWLQMAAEQGPWAAGADEIGRGFTRGGGESKPVTTPRPVFWFLLATDGSNGIHRLNAPIRLCPPPAAKFDKGRARPHDQGWRGAGSPANEAHRLSAISSWLIGVA